MDLFSPLKLGALELPNRVILAPLTRCRASQGRVPNDLMREYYVQRASAGMMFTEATSVSPMGVGYPDTPGIWSGEQVVGWKRITDAVHEVEGRIVLQLWHVGRISDPAYLGGQLPVAPSAVKPEGTVSLVRPKKEFETPRALELEEIPGVIEAYRQGAANALEAGFDGVEVHGANGYLPDQFLRDGSNVRTDEYGGPLENRARFLLQVAEAAIGVWGADRVGVHLSPRNGTHGAFDSDVATTFTYVARELKKRSVAYLCVRESLGGGERYGPLIKAAFGGPYIVNEDFSRDSAQQVLEAGEADAVAWGKMFIANPDLPARLRHDGPYNEPDPSTFYASGAKGYIDYPAL